MDVHRRGLGLRGVSAKDEPQRRAPRRCDIIMPEADPMYKVSDGRGAFKQRATSPTGGSLALVRKPFGRTTCRSWSTRRAPDLRLGPRAGHNDVRSLAEADRRAAGRRPGIATARAHRFRQRVPRLPSTVDQVEPPRETFLMLTPFGGTRNANGRLVLAASSFILGQFRTSC